MNPAARDCVITRRGGWESSVEEMYFFTKRITSSFEAGLYAALRSYMFELGVHSEGGPDADVTKSF